MKNLQRVKPKLLPKCPTGITGFDTISAGGIPRNRPTLICGGPGSGKSMFGMEFLINGVLHYKEPGLFIAFEETAAELSQNISSLGFDVKDLVKRNQLILEHISIDRTEFKEIGSYNLDGLFIRLGQIIDKFKIKRVVVDTLEILFSNLENDLIIRAELQRLFRWFKEKKVTVIITAEQGANQLSRYGLEEYVADCVILLDNRMDQQISTRRLRIAKYRGSPHGCNEYPFVITEHGFAINAITSIRLNYKVTKKRISSGIKQLDTMLGGKGFFKGSSILCTGAAGIGKSSFAAAFANATCKSGERCLYFAFEESVEQIIRNMNSISIHLDQWVQKKLLQFYAINPNAYGLEAHLVDIQRLTNEFEPSVVIIDPITNLKSVGQINEVEDILSMLIAFFKQKGITILFTSLVKEGKAFNHINTEEDISSSMDTWIYLQYIYGEGERNRGISILKSRGMKHSNQLREVIFSDKGIILRNVYIGQGKVLAGSERLIQATKLEIENLKRESEVQLKERSIEAKRKIFETKISTLQTLLENAKEEAQFLSLNKKHTYDLVEKNRAQISKIRMADAKVSKKKVKKRK